MAEFAV